MRRAGSARHARTKWAGALLVLGFVFVAFVALAPAAWAQSVCTPLSKKQVVEMDTLHGSTAGKITLHLCLDDLPITVNNFLAYVDSGAYTDTGFIHRSPVGLDVIQGGGFYVEDGVSKSVEQLDPITREKFGFSNVRGTIAMASGGNPPTAGSQWFINTEDNPSLNTNPGLTEGWQVFGEVVAGMDDVDEIRALDPYEINAGVFKEVPMDPAFETDLGNPVDHVVYVTNIVNLPEPTAGVQSAAALTALALLAARRRRMAAQSTS
jgi:peptidyl-prolyl cis-trans isomerase A (cyclophilin A)